ncbi:MAG: hypothetical protein KKG60_03520 [Nanoarchaeota archaeon]|nr:hypothetical protein [Nanoarchaeota archaeon]
MSGIDNQKREISMDDVLVLRRSSGKSLDFNFRHPFKGKEKDVVLYFFEMKKENIPLFSQVDGTDLVGFYDVATSSIWKLRVGFKEVDVVLMGREGGFNKYFAKMDAGGEFSELISEISHLTKIYPEREKIGQQYPFRNYSRPLEVFCGYM